MTPLTRVHRVICSAAAVASLGLAAAGTPALGDELLLTHRSPYVYNSSPAAISNYLATSTPTYGGGNTSTVYQYGTNNSAVADTSRYDGNTTVQMQLGNGNSSQLNAVGSNNTLSSAQLGTGNSSTITAYGSNNTYGVTQIGANLSFTMQRVGNNGSISVTQTGVGR